MNEPSSLLVRHVHEMARHMAWADATVWSAVLTAPAAANDGRTTDTLHHIHLVQHLFLQAWRDAPLAVRERSEFPTLDTLATFGQEGRRGVLAFVESATAQELEREIRMPWAAFYEQQSQQPAGVHTVGESLLQVFLHTQHHRGQVCMRLRELGVVPPTVDFIVWLWSGRPAENVAV